MKHLLCICIIGMFVGCGGKGSSNAQPSANQSSFSSNASSTTLSSSSSSTSDSLSLAVDNQVQSMMDATGASAVTIAIAKNGQIIYTKGYGYQDAAHTIPLQTDALMRTASIIKPVTAAAIRKLESNNKLALSDHAFCTGTNAPCWLPANLLSASTDPRVRDITIQQLIYHQGGRSRASDVFGREWAACRIYSCPISTSNLVKIVLAEPLDYTPGEPGNLDSYSNFGYLVLGMIIEQASQVSYTEFVQNDIMAPLGVSANDFKAGKTRPQDRDPREPIYITSYNAQSAYTIGKVAPFADEGFVAENWKAVGTSITTARALALFASAYRLPNGQPLAPNETYMRNHWGLIDGTMTFLRQLPSGVSYAVLLNKYNTDFPLYEPQLDSVMQLVP